MSEQQATPKTISIAKSPRETFIQGLDFSPWLMEQGSTLKQWSAQVSPSKSGGLKVASMVQIGDALELAFTGGTVGDFYVVSVNVLAQNSASTKVDVTVRVRGTSEDQVAGSGGVVLVRPLITVPSVSVAESAGYAVAAVVLSIPAIDDIELTASASPVTASGADFSLPVQWSLTGATWSDGPAVTIPAGAASFYLRVAIVDDAITEADETLTLSVDVLSGSTQNSQSSGTVTIVANDVLPSLAIGAVAVDEGQAASFTVTLSEPSAQTVTVAYATRAGSASAADFTPASGTLLFAPGITQQTVTVPTRVDAIPEAPETFFVDLSAAVNATISAANGVATIRLNQPAANATAMTLLLGDLAGGSFYLGL